MIRSNLLARRVAAASAGPVSASRAAAMPTSSAAVDALVNCHYHHGASSSSVTTTAGRFPTTIAPSHMLATKRNFSADSAATELGSILTREIEEEDEAASEFDGKLPPELADLDAEIRKKWTVLEGISGIGGTSSGETGSGATMRMFRKESGSKGAKIGIVFHCQDTEEDVKFDEEDFMNQQQEGGEGDEEEEAAQAVRFGVTVSKGGKTVVIQSRAGATGDVAVESVVVRDGDTEGVLAALAGGEGTHAALYQGPEFTELAEDLQESYQRYIVEECGVDDDVRAYISMYADYREQEEYVSWMKTAVEILD